MSRSVVFTFIVAAISAVIASVLHARGFLAHPEAWLAQHGDVGQTTRAVMETWQHVFIAMAALGTAWLTMTTRRRGRVGWLVVALSAELIALMWICALYRVFFQPLPVILAAVLAYAAALVCLALPRRRARVPLAAFDGKLSPEQIARIRSGDVTFDASPRLFEATVLACDLPGKYDLAEISEPDAVAQTSDQFTTRTREILLRAGAYMQAADGEGVVAVFGFADAATDHADKAVRAAFELIRALAGSLHGSNGENELGTGVHVGISSGAMIAAARPEKNDFFLMGEPMELARRFCVANRFYGSRILIGPRSFELVNNTFLSRPIDFLSGINAQERHEIYEPLASVAEAPKDLIARRDYFWNGVVLYREKRWGEAYTEFQKARDPKDEDDAPLNLYLRRLEPLALHLVEGGND
jgi:adenylate cyclase